MSTEIGSNQYYKLVNTTKKIAKKITMQSLYIYNMYSMCEFKSEG